MAIMKLPKEISIGLVIDMKKLCQFFIILRLQIQIGKARELMMIV